MTILDNLTSGKRENVPPQADLVVVDVGDFATVENIISEKSIEVIFHLAAQIDVRKSVADPLFENHFVETHRSAKLGEQKTSSLSANRINNELSWQPRVTFSRGIALTYEWFRALAA